MKKIQVTLKGTMPLLMHSAAGMMQQQPKKNPKKEYNQVEEAEKVAYRDDKKFLIIPSRCIKACILNASSWYKIGKRSMKQIIAGGTRIEPENPRITNNKGKPIKDYDIDLRPVNVQQNKIIRARPKISEWNISFDLIYNEKIIGSTPQDLKQLNEIIEEAGQRIGLLDNRPQKYGDNGTFVVTKFLPK